MPIVINLLNMMRSICNLLLNFISLEDKDNKLMNLNYLAFTFLRNFGFNK